MSATTGRRKSGRPGFFDPPKEEREALLAEARASTIVDPEYTQAEARKQTDEVKMDMESLWQRLKDLHDRKAWKALGYTSWRHYCFAEFNISKSRAYQLVNAAKVAEEIDKARIEEKYGKNGFSYASTPDPKLTFNEAQLRELGKDDYPQKAWDVAIKRFGDKPTAAQIKEVVDERKGTKDWAYRKPPKPRKVGSLTLSLARPSMVANGVSTCRASASLVDKEGQPFGGQKVTFDAWEKTKDSNKATNSNKVQFGDVKDHGNGGGTGTYSVIVTAGKEIGDLAIRAHVESEGGDHVRSNTATLSLTAPKPEPAPKAKAKAEPKPKAATPKAATPKAKAEPEPEPQAATSRWFRLSEGVRDIRGMRNEAAAMLQALSSEQVWRLSEGDAGGYPDQVGEDVLIELDRAALELSFAMSYLVARLLRPDLPESWGPKPEYIAKLETTTW